MNINFTDLQIAVVFILIAAGLVVWIRSKMAADSRSRMYRMMAKVGVYPKSLSRNSPDSGLDMDAVRRRCNKCPCEDVCERWLAGEIEGDHGFCPNAKVFDGVIGPA